MKIFYYVKFHIKSVYHLFKIMKDVDVVVFHICTTIVLPMFFSKIMKKKTILIFTGSATDSLKKTRGKGNK